MKANELMIGDWVYRPDCYDKVTEIRGNFILGYDLLRGTMPLTQIKPIPLTAEILIANGFRESIEEGVYYFPERYQEVNNRGFAVETEGDGKWFITDHQLIEFSHVHKFQHILRDCEMTDLADNFKVSPN